MASVTAWLMSDREKWLNGWPRMGRHVLIFESLHCAGCGKFDGVTCATGRDDWTPPERNPDWPFGESDCPLCSETEPPPDAPKTVQEAYQLGLKRGAGPPIA